ncbi:MAG: dihydroneopterin aldolase [Thermostichales cyanobacterium SZTDM-1c_bins_54]
MDSSLPDRIQITGLRYYGYTGYLEEERKLGQWFEIDFELWTHLQPAAASDELGDTLDYRSAVSKIAELVRTSRFLLIEKLAEEIAAIILRETGAARTRVRLTKCAPPDPDMTGKVTLEIVRPLPSGS